MNFELTFKRKKAKRSSLSLPIYLAIEYLNRLIIDKINRKNWQPSRFKTKGPNILHLFFLLMTFFSLIKQIKKLLKQRTKYFQRL